MIEPIVLARSRIILDELTTHTLSASGPAATEQVYVWIQRKI